MVGYGHIVWCLDDFTDNVFTEKRGCGYIIIVLEFEPSYRCHRWTSLKPGWDEHIIIVWSLDHVIGRPRCENI